MGLVYDIQAQDFLAHLTTLKCPQINWQHCPTTFPPLPPSPPLPHSHVSQYGHSHMSLIYHLRNIKSKHLNSLKATSKLDQGPWVVDGATNVFNLLGASFMEVVAESLKMKHRSQLIVDMKGFRHFSCVALTCVYLYSSSK